MADTPNFRVKRKSHRPPIEFPVTIETYEGVPVNPDEPDGDKHSVEVEVVEKFHAKGTCPGDILLSVAASMTREGGWQAAAIKDLFDYAVVDEDRERWVAFLRHPDAPDISELGDIADWLLEQYGDRPTTQSSESSDG